MIYAALIMGLLGSLHCVGMCGPLLVLMRTKDGKVSLSSVLLYHMGRISTYMILGLMVAILGEGLRLVGVQQYISLILGILILFFILFARNPEQTMFRVLRLDKGTKVLHQFYGRLMKKNVFAAKFILGSLNGLLPCGLVYSALLLSLGTETGFEAGAVMLVFGLGTLPTLFFLEWIQKFVKFKFKRVFQYSMLLVGILFILRGANLNIPYLSPSVDKQEVKCCKKH